MCSAAILKILTQPPSQHPKMSCHFKTNEKGSNMAKQLGSIHFIEIWHWQMLLNLKMRHPIFGKNFFFATWTCGVFRAIASDSWFILYATLAMQWTHTAAQNDQTIKFVKIQPKPHMFLLLCAVLHLFFTNIRRANG